ncbi:unnamed protein product [Rotaria socialis]|uniref:RRM domain-containing protein n=8 Tax=Rotaria socialis TaxID=392032 RepID=A0A817RAG5_9BILA|nr:unnamed protein product [Rotaria socialis]CAF3475298.1 unnamed protein product [Rotaria socialis]CAF3604194.1 unnamed protein product [Rotaria socialis]CAF3614839.1 unnamed protein product [Rotaria socialis]CAF3714423.1 unnamed protein product [Rotaria socialis]
MVNQSFSSSNKSYSSTADQNKKIFLGGLSYNTTDDTLRAFCSRFGKMTDCVVMRTPEGKSRGFGFVTYEDTSAVEDFMRARPHTIDNRLIDTKRAMPREDQNSAESHLTVKKLFVAGLRDGIDEPCLRQYFTRFGNITEVLVMNDRDGKPRGFAFVTFDDYDAVDKVILEKPHIVNGRNLDVKKAVPKDKIQDNSGSTGGQPSRNYSGSNQRNNFGSIRDNFDANSSGWDSQPQVQSYGQQGYNNSNESGFNPSNASGFSSAYDSARPQQPLMNYNHNNNSSIPNMPYNSGNQLPNSNYMPSNYASNQPQGYGTNSNGFNSMNNPFNLPPQQNNNNSSISGYNNNPSYPSDNINSYDNSTQNYNYNDMQPQQQTRGGGPMHNKRGRGGNFGGNNNSSNYGNRSAPYSTRGGRGGGRGRGQ